MRDRSYHSQFGWDWGFAVEVVDWAGEVGWSAPEVDDFLVVVECFVEVAECAASVAGAGGHCRWAGFLRREWELPRRDLVLVLLVRGLHFAERECQVRALKRDCPCYRPALGL